MITQIKFPKRLLYADDIEKSLAVDGFREALGCCDLHKSKKTRPGNTEDRYRGSYEEQFYDFLWKREKMREEINEYVKKNDLLKVQVTPAKKNKFKKFLAKIFEVNYDKISDLVLQSFLVGVRQTTIKDVNLNLATLPDTIRAAIKNKEITLEQARRLRMSQILTGERITAISEFSKHRIVQSVMEVNIGKMGRHKFEEMMLKEFDDDGLLNRDMQRISITEINTNANAGFISGQHEGGYVVGVSHDDACRWCLKHVHGKILQVIDTPPPDYAHLDPGSRQYKEISKMWDTKIWATKTNFDRSLAPRKRTDTGLVDREHHELARPGVMNHPYCRCRWIPFHFDYMYLENGDIQFVSNDKEEKKRAEWVKKYLAHNDI